MQKHNFVNSDYAVSELVGGLLLIMIAVTTFSAIYMYVFPLPLPSEEINVQLVGYVDNNGNAVIKHMGGEPLDTYRVDVKYVDGTLIDSTTLNNKWTIGGEYSDIPTLSDETDKVHVIIYSYKDDGGEEAVFDGILYGRPSKSTPETYMLVSSLKTNTSEEDLICFNYYIKNQFPNASRYLYNWMLNGNPFAELILTFDNNNDTNTKDYSGNNNNGTIATAAWSSDGIIGGCYHFDGASDHISLNLPSVFNAIYRNHFTISLWLKSENVADDHRVVLEASQDSQNFAKIFQYGSQIHFAVRVNKGKKVDNVVRTGNLTDNTWYNIVCTWNAGNDEIAIYTDGIQMDSSNDGYRQYSLGTEDGKFEIGHGAASSRFWYGWMDELQVFPRVLSDEQIYQSYLSVKYGNSDKRVIVADETNIGDVWECNIIPINSIQDFSSITTNDLEIISYGGGI